MVRIEATAVMPSKIFPDFVSSPDHHILSGLFEIVVECFVGDIKQFVIGSDTVVVTVILNPFKEPSRHPRDSRFPIVVTICRVFSSPNLHESDFHICRFGDEEVLAFEGDNESRTWAGSGHNPGCEPCPLAGHGLDNLLELVGTRVQSITLITRADSNHTRFSDAPGLYLASQFSGMKPLYCARFREEKKCETSAVRRF